MHICTFKKQNNNNNISFPHILAPCSFLFLARNNCYSITLLKTNEVFIVPVLGFNKIVTDHLCPIFFFFLYLLYFLIEFNYILSLSFPLSLFFDIAMLNKLEKPHLEINSNLLSVNSGPPSPALSSTSFISSVSWMAEKTSNELIPLLKNAYGALKDKERGNVKKEILS